jgi:hypothetical protein
MLQCDLCYAVIQSGQLAYPSTQIFIIFCGENIENPLLDILKHSTLLTIVTLLYNRVAELIHFIQ